MFKVSFGLFLFIIPAIFVITVIAFLIYKNMYDKHTNKVLEEGESNSRKWLAPWAFALITLCSLLVLVAGIMYPLSMLMVKPDTSGETISLGEDTGCAFIYEFNYDHDYLPLDSDYRLISQSNNENVGCMIFGKDNGDGTVTYYVSGTISDPEKANTSYAVCMGNDDIFRFFVGTEATHQEQSDNFFFNIIYTGEEYNDGIVMIAVESVENPPAQTGDNSKNLNWPTFRNEYSFEF